MPTLEAPLSAGITDKPPDPVDEQARATRRTDPVDQLPVPPYPASQGRAGSTEVFQHCLDLVVSGNHAANSTIRKFAATVDQVAPLDSVGPARQLELIAAALEMTQRLAHAPFDLGRSFVQSAVVVDVDVDVDIASRQGALQEGRR